MEKFFMEKRFSKGEIIQDSDLEQRPFSLPIERSHSMQTKANDFSGDSLKPDRRVFSISVPVLMLPLFAFGILLFMASAGAWRTYRFQQVEQESHRLEMENRLAKSRIQDQDSRIEHLTREMLNMRKGRLCSELPGIETAGSRCR
jgi:hypothetical protein